MSVLHVDLGNVHKDVPQLQSKYVLDMDIFGPTEEDPGYTNHFYAHELLYASKSYVFKGKLVTGMQLPSPSQYPVDVVCKLAINDPSSLREEAELYATIPDEEQGYYTPLFLDYYSGDDDYDDPVGCMLLEYCGVPLLQYCGLPKHAGWGSVPVEFKYVESPFCALLAY